MRSLLLFIRLSRPLFLAGAAVVYALGVGIAHYLGVPLNWGVYALGQAWVILLQLSAQYLNEYYDSLADLENPNRTFLTGGSDTLGEDKLPRRVALLAALTCLAFLASLTVILIAGAIPSPAVYLIMILAFLGAFFYSTPPVRLEATGYGELTTSVMVAFLLPAFAFLLQAGELNRLVAMSAFPLFALHMAMLLAFELPDYPNDLKFDKRTIMVRLGWATGMTLHNIMILSAFLLLLFAGALGFPWFAMLAGLLSLPIGLFQFWQMRSIARGAPANWNGLTIGAVALFISMAYFIAFAFWTN
jgi:1,4-dihydroxy-2-naphthoate octaprenyltransferase